MIVGRACARKSSAARAVDGSAARGLKIPHAVPIGRSDVGLRGRGDDRVEREREGKRGGGR